MGTKTGNRLLVRQQVFQPRLPGRTVRRNTSRPDMSAVQTWTLWQRMPPRFQLTSHGYIDDLDDSLSISSAREKSASPKLSSTPRPASARESPAVPQAGMQINEKENFMLSNNVSFAVQQQMTHNVKQGTAGLSFPKRKSDYINTFQMQRRVNSTRRRLAEAPPTSNIPAPIKKSVPRAQTAPIYPVTDPDSHNDRKPKLSENILLDRKLQTNSAQSRATSTGEATKIDLIHFDDNKSVSSSSSSFQMSRDTKPKKLVIQDTSKATIYIDNGKVRSFGKSRHDLTHLLKTQSLRSDRGSCFLADLRRDYLKHPKYDSGKLSSTFGHQKDDPKTVACERVDYNRRVEHILNYYTDDNSFYPTNYRPRLSAGYRPLSPRGSRMKGLALTMAAPSRPPSRASSPTQGDRPDSPNGFIRLNKQSKLHERKFYLRTPGMRQSMNVDELQKCSCSMCRMELQLALVTGFDKSLIHHHLMGNTPQMQVNVSKIELQNSSAVPTPVNSNPVNNGNNPIKHEVIPDSQELKKPTAQKVSFKQPEVVSPVQEHTLTISCTLPEVGDIAVSESGFESARTTDAETMAPQN